MSVAPSVCSSRLGGTSTGPDVALKEPWFHVMPHGKEIVMLQLHHPLTDV
jgi:hypothetical protein